MERTLGKANLAKLIQRYEEDEQNREWLENSTTKCPGCGVFCEKSHGKPNLSNKSHLPLTVSLLLQDATMCANCMFTL